METLLDSDVVSQFDAIRRIGVALTNVSFSAEACFVPDDAQLRLPTTAAADSLLVLRAVGSALLSASDALSAAVAQQLVDFFTHLRAKEAASITALLSFRAEDAPPAVDAPMSPNRAAQTAPNPNAPLARRLQTRRRAITALQTSLYVWMESALTESGALCAAVFLADAGGVALHRAAHINGERRLPAEVRMDAQSALATVVRTGVAANLRGMGARPIDGTGRYPLHCANVLMVPIRNKGCVLLADRAAGMGALEEHLAWSLAVLCEGIITRFPIDMFVGEPWAPMVSPLQQCSLLPVIEPCLTLPAANVHNAIDVENIPTVPKRITILRSEREHLDFRNDSKRVQQGELSHEAHFQDIASYLVNIESLWQKSLRETNDMRHVITNHSRELEEKRNQIIQLQAQLKKVELRCNNAEKKSNASRNPVS